jgi:predicted dehydrogenase
MTMQKKYKIAMIGLGSIGERHLKNIDKVLGDRGIEYTIDLIRRKSSSKIQKSAEKLVTTVFTETDNIPDDYDVLFITNPTHLHLDTIKKFGPRSRNIFIEKPVFEDANVDVTDLYLDESGIYYVACPLRYTEVLQYIKNNVDLKTVHSARAVCSSYLPDWRQGTDYRKSYSAHAEQGGGVSIDLIHEWDYMIYLFGLPNQVLNYRGKFSHLEIDSDDLSVYIAKYDNMLAEIHLDYFGRKPIRELQLITADETIVADIANSEIRFLNQNKVMRFDEDRNSYQIKEIENFFDIIDGKRRNENNIATALATLKIAKDGII